MTVVMEVTSEIAGLKIKLKLCAKTKSSVAHLRVPAFLFNGVVILITTVQMHRTKQIAIEIQLAIHGCLVAEMESAFTRHGHGMLILHSFLENLL
jgi:hypothetical protein